MSAETPEGVSGLLADLDALARRGLASTGAVVEVATLLPVVPASARFLPASSAEESSLRYEVRGPLGGRHSLRLIVGSDGESAVGHHSYDYVSPLFRSMPRAHFDAEDTEEVAASLAEKEAAQVRRAGASRAEGPSTIAASNAAVAGFLTALAAADVAAVEGALRDTPALARWHSVVAQATAVSGEVREADLVAATVLVSSLSAGAPTEWVLRRLEGLGE